MFGGFLLAFGWGMASSQGPAHIYPDKPLDLEDHQADAARPGCGTSGKLGLVEKPLADWAHPVLWPELSPVSLHLRVLK